MTNAYVDLGEFVMKEVVPSYIGRNNSSQGNVFSDKVLISTHDIKAKVFHLAQELNARYKYAQYVDVDVMVVGILTGSVPFVVDLTQSLTFDHQLKFMSASSYVDNKKSTLTFSKDIVIDKLTTVILVDDIADSGETMAEIKKYFEDMPNVGSVSTVAFIDKACHVDYSCYRPGENLELNDNEFVYGYGMDLDGIHRNLTDLFVVSM